MIGFVQRLFFNNRKAFSYLHDGRVYHWNKHGAYRLNTTYSCSNYLTVLDVSNSFNIKKKYIGPTLFLLSTRSGLDRVYLN